MPGMNNNKHAIAAHLNRFAQPLLDRDGVVVHSVEGLDVDGRYHHQTQQISIDLTRILSNEEQAALTSDPAAVLAHQRVLGVLVHEAGHANHTPVWNVAPEVWDWAVLLEEPRIERAMCRRDPDLRHALRPAAAAAWPSGPVPSVGDAFEVLIVVGGRVAAGVFDARERAVQLAEARALLEPGDAAAIEAIVARAIDLPNTDSWTMGGLCTDLAAIAERYQVAAKPPPCGVSRAGAPPATPAPEVSRAPRLSGGVLAVESVTQWLEVRDLRDDEYERRAVTEADRRAVGIHIAGAAPAETEGYGRVLQAAASPPGRLRTLELIRDEAAEEFGLPTNALPWVRRRRVGVPCEIELGIVLDR